VNPQAAIRNPKSEIERPPAQPLWQSAVAHQIIAEYLRRWCGSAGRARPKHRIRGELAAAGLALSTRDLERAIQAAVLAGFPIGSSREGFFWCQWPEDFGVALSYLVCRMKPQRQRIDALGRAMRDRFPDEPLLTEVTE